MVSSNTHPLFKALTGVGDERTCHDISDGACEQEPASFETHVFSVSASKIADGLIDPKLVLAWLLTSLSAPALFIGLLVPIREAGALLPQLFIAGGIQRMALRKRAWAVGAGIQGGAALSMGFAALYLTGSALGIAIISALAVMAVARSICSVTYKDVLGKTVSQSRRGTATGTASSVGAGAVLVFGGVLAATIFPRMSVVTVGLFLAGAAWVISALAFSRMYEEPSDTHDEASPLQAGLNNLSLLKQDAQLRRFILARGLLISTALAPPFMVSLAAQAGGRAADQNAFGGLGLLVIASALAGLLSSYVWGRLADRSSRKVLIFTAGAASLALLATLGLHALSLLGEIWALPLVLFGLMIAYQGVRLGRSTHLVDMATPETRAAYTALSNTIIGILLLLGGAFSLVAEYAGEAVTLMCLCAMSLLAIPAAIGLNQVQNA